MTKNKNRLYIAVYPSGQGIGRFHWALLVGPKKEPGPVAGQRYHVKNQSAAPRWHYDATHVEDVRGTIQLLVRVTIAKIVDEARLINILESVPVAPPDWEGKKDGREPRWTCRVWLIAALKAIRADGGAVGSNFLDDIEGPNGVIEKTKAFVGRQIQNRRYDSNTNALEPKPLLDLFSGKESYI